MLFVFGQIFFDSAVAWSRCPKFHLGADRLTPFLNYFPAKEASIRGAVDYHIEQLGPLLTTVIPICSDVDRGRDFGVQQWLVPAIIALLQDARACAMLRVLHADLDKQRFSTLVNQVRSAGCELIKAATGEPAANSLQEFVSGQ